MTESKIALKRELAVSAEQFDQVENIVKEVFKAKGFGVLTEINVKDVLKEKLNIESKPHKILGMCNPNRAHKVLQENMDMSALLPCNVSVYVNENGKITVSAMNPVAVLSLVESPIVEEVAKDVLTVFEEALDEVSQKFS